VSLRETLVMPDDDKVLPAGIENRGGLWDRAGSTTSNGRGEIGEVEDPPGPVVVVHASRSTSLTTRTPRANRLASLPAIAISRLSASSSPARGPRKRMRRVGEGELAGDAQPESPRRHPDNVRARVFNRRRLCVAALVTLNNDVASIVGPLLKADSHRTLDDSGRSPGH